ncbi:hypothetical protein LBMAG42_21430 [Deltaproteobacteria bacterium]|nr:hypothetical protein LBMAG42_21430 [Deltaproteobacteria bacterium]
MIRLSALCLLVACVEEPEPTFEAEDCVAAQGEELTDATISGTLAADTGDGRTLTEVVVTTPEWTVTFDGGSLAATSDHCDCTSEVFSFANVTDPDGPELASVVSGGNVCFRNTSSCGEVELIGAGISGVPALYVSGFGDLVCDSE